MSDAFSTFHFPFSIQEGRVERKFVLKSGGLDARWNLAKVTRRGLGVSVEQLIVKCRLQGSCVIVK